MHIERIKNGDYHYKERPSSSSKKNIRCHSLGSGNGNQKGLGSLATLTPTPQLISNCDLRGRNKHERGITMDVTTVLTLFIGSIILIVCGAILISIGEKTKSKFFGSVGIGAIAIGSAIIGGLITKLY